MLKRKFLESCGSTCINNFSVIRARWIRMQATKFAINSMELPKMPDCAYVPPTYNGASYESVRKAHESVVAPSLFPFYKKPLLMHEGRGQWLWDHVGKRYLDMFAGIATVSVGHSHPRISAAIAEQSSKLNHISSIYMHPRLPEYVAKLTAKFPEKLKVVYLTNSGSEANELAFLIAKLHTGKDNIISLRNAYHGGTYATSAATSLSTWKAPIAQPPGHIKTIYPDVYRHTGSDLRCINSPAQVKGKGCKCTPEECIASDKYFQDFMEVFYYDLSKTQNTAAFIAESIQGVGGVVQYPKTFLQKVYRYVRQNGGLCIADEVQTGFGRTGEHFWGFEDHDVIPDIVTMAKGIGNGFPIGAVVTTPEIANCLKSVLHFNTFGGNPIACAVGSTVLDIIDEEGLQKNADIVGTYLINQLSTLVSDFPNIVGDVRGKGLMIGVELISDPKTKQQLEQQRMRDIFEDIKDMGVLVGLGGLHANILRIKPPLCVTKADADFTFHVISRAIQKHQDKHLRSKDST